MFNLNKGVCMVPFIPLVIFSSNEFLLVLHSTICPMLGLYTAIVGLMHLRGLTPQYPNDKELNYKVGFWMGIGGLFIGVLGIYGLIFLMFLLVYFVVFTRNKK